MTSCYKADSENISKIKNGMSTEEALFLMGIDDVGDWDACQGNGVFEYGANYSTPTGYKETFWITVKDGVVIETYSCR
jgi:hypothetical protein